MDDLFHITAVAIMVGTVAAAVLFSLAGWLPFVNLIPMVR